MSKFVKWIKYEVVIHIALTIMLIGIGIVFSSPNTNFYSNPSFDKLEELAGAKEWSLIFLAGGFCGLLGLVTYIRWIEYASVFVISTMHAFFAIEIYRASSATPGTVAYGLFAFLGYVLLAKRVL